LSARRRLLVVSAERTRIARELHDTLLQGLVGIAFQFDGISQQLASSPEMALRRMAALREHVQRYIKETRWAIWALRSPIAAELDLPVVLERMSVRLLSDTEVDLAFRTTGIRRTLSEAVQQQVLRITHEAIMNVVRHSRARTLNVQLSYEESSLRLRISDDGVGFAGSNHANASQERWGLLTMRERAEQIDATLSIRTDAGSGTEITLVVPFDSRTPDAVV
jgi:signal transduction histidine kinase